MLIDKEAALKKMCEMCYYNTGQNFVCRKCNVYELLAEQPAVEAEPVRHGRWVVNDRNPDYADCTNCGLSEWLGANGSKEYAETLLSGFKKYCPNCGARMNEKEGVNS